MITTATFQAVPLMHHCVSRIKSHITKYHKSPSVCQHHCLQYTRTAPFCTTPAQNHDFLKPLEPKNHKTETVPQLLNNVFSDHRTLDMPETTNWSSDPMSSMIFFSTVLPKKRTEPKSVFFFFNLALSQLADELLEPNSQGENVEVTTSIRSSVLQRSVKHISRY